MLKSYLAIIWRHLRTQLLYSAINVLGLAVGLACCILIALFVRYELGYDTQWADPERTFRISRDYFAADGARARVPASNNAPVAPALVEDFAGIEQAARVWGGNVLLGRGDRGFYEEGVRFADPALLELYGFEWLRGEPDDALAEPFSIVLTESLAVKYFGDEDPVGQSLTLSNARPYEVTGVVADLPADTHLSLSGLIPMSSLVRVFGPGMLEDWNGQTDFHTYFRLAEGADPEAVERGIPAFVDRHIPDYPSDVSGMTIMNVRDIHLRSGRDEEWKPKGSLAAIYGFSAIALGILLIACINFMNLATARASTRAREVGMRKAMGASRGQMITQFIGESILMSAIATMLAVALVELLLPAFSAFTGTEIAFDYLTEPGLALALVGLLVLVGLAAGSYPAFYLSAFEPGRVLRGELTGGTGGAAFRNVLVVFQFAVAIVLVIGTAVVHQQTSYARSLDLGFDRERIVLLTGMASERLESQWRAFKRELKSHPGVVDVTASHYTPFSFNDNRVSVRRQGGSSFNRIQFMGVDYDFFETYEIDVLAGRTFSPDIPRDVLRLPSAETPQTRAAFIVNASAARLFGWTPAEAADRAIELGLDESFNVRLEGPIVGVVRDTHFEPVDVAVRPLIFLLYPEFSIPGAPMINVASIRIEGEGIQETLAHVDSTWRAFVPEEPVRRRFLDRDFEALYRDEQRQRVMLGAFSGLAVFVACLGLIGLASFMTEQRTKEIGVRKVMGGTVWEITRLFTGRFSKLVLVASVIAWPVAYVLMRRWLEGFAYRIDLSALTFAGSALLAFAIVFATVGTVAARAASANPAYSLRQE